MDAFIGEIRPFAFSFAPQGWLECNGQAVPIALYQALAAIVGNTYGNPPNPQSFVLPNLNGQAAVGVGSSTAPGSAINWLLGSKHGTESATVSASQIPSHNHTLVMEKLTSPVGSQANSSAAPVANSSWLARPAQVSGPDVSAIIPNFTLAASGIQVDTTLHASTLGITGGNATHENRQPYLPLLYCICNDGLFPQHP